MANTYPNMEQQLTDLLSRIVANDREIERINTRGLPDGAKALRVAELVARGLGNFRVDGHTQRPAHHQVRLPAFKFDKFDPFTWPPRQ